MLSRREVITGGLVGGLAKAPEAHAETVQQDREMLKEIKGSIDGVQGSLDRAFNTLSLAVGPVGRLREVFEQFLRSNGKFPDFCEIGARVFYDIYDWHIRNRQQLVVLRQADNRYTIQFMFTTLILKFENQVDFIGYPYDKA
jgi:hypothetical protein